jgi:hypothetical protein
MPLELLDRGVQRGVRGVQLAWRERDRERGPQSLAQPDQVVERHLFATVDGRRPVRVLADGRGVVRRHADRQALGEELGVAKPTAEPSLVRSFAQGRVTIECDGQRAGGELRGTVADAPRGVGKARRGVERRQAEAWVAHDGESTVRQEPAPRSGRYDGRVTDPAPPPTPGERRLDHPPSDRYRDATGEADPGAGATPRSSGSTGRAVAWGFLAGLVGAAVTVVLGGVLSLSAGLLVVAAGTGWAIGTATRVGAGDAFGRDRRPWVALGLAIVTVALGQIGLWLYARTEGGVLALPDYLAQTFGLLVLVQAVVALGLAWWSAR